MRKSKRNMLAAVIVWLALTEVVYGDCYSDTNEPSLLITPEHDIITWAVQESHLLSCTACVKNKDLISDMKWYDNNGREIRSKGDSVSRTSMYTEKTSSGRFMLVFPSLTESQAGNYTCTATYANTQKLKKMVMVTTIIAITFVDAPEEQFPILHSSYKIRCKVEANPKPTVDWYKNGALLTRNDHYIPELDGLNIKDVVASDDGTYLCRVIVIDTGELQERFIKVEVHTPPEFLPMKNVVEVIEGEPAKLHCKAEGKPNPKFTWIKKRTAENLATADRFRVDENTGELWITRVSSDDRGELNCVAKNAAGTKDITIILDVIVRPKVVTYANISIPVGSTALLSCSAFGQPMPEITFRKQGLNMEFARGQTMNDRIFVENRQDLPKQETIGTITITALERSDDGLYECIARNKGGEGRKFGHLTVEFKPSFSSTPMKEAWTWERHPVNLTCIAESIPNATIVWKLNDRDLERNENRDPQIQKIGNGPISVLRVTPLGVIHYGHYKCMASNKHGTAETIIHLKEAKIPSVIMQAKFDVVTATTITFSFPGPATDGGMPIRAYIVRYKRHMEDWAMAKNKTWAVDSPYILENLDPETRYNFEFAAQNDVGMGPWGAQLSRVMPRRSAPAEPKFLNRLENNIAYSIYRDQFELQWKIPADNGEYIDRYEVSYCPVYRVNNYWEIEADGQCEKVKLVASNSPSYVMKNLKYDTYYKVELRAHNIIGDSVPGQIIVKTVAGAGSNFPPSNTGLSSAIIICAVLVALVIILVVVDLSCYCLYKAGLIMLICEKTHKKQKSEDDIKLGSDEKEPLKNEHEVAMIKPCMKVDYDMKRSISKTSFVGKDSAV